jgi:putative membrane protein insertion efficiency factor
MSLMGKLLNAMFHLYQVAVSPYLAMSCRFQPTCSSYARQAITRHGAVAGGLMALRRIARCHPWGGSGYEPVPAERHDAGRSVEQGR